MPLLAERGGDVWLAVHLQPRAARTELAGLHGDALKVRVAAPPAEGAANGALCAFLAAHLGLPPSRVRIQRGATSRAKVVCLQGVRAAEVAARLNLPAP
ncbi:MAG TPA: DUF167 domain-containing protein [Candidatus Sulfotelmatobacter sp.]|nr:DUF167 domain-containing protein [Candidatus Sulfotelmatobacter sp.]